MTEKHFILATAGHVDHGKSALIKALTGTDPDRLPEEKARGITIELGFAHLQLPGPNELDEIYHVGIIDVPGHEDFVKNMVAGVGAIDLALLVVAADDGWMPQTEEHLQILAYLDVKRAVVALTKIDLIESLVEATAETRQQLRDSPFAEAPIIGTSVATHQGLAELSSRLSAVFSTINPQPDSGKPRLGVDRAFTLRGIGTVVTGTVFGGTFRRGDAVVIQPGDRPARIRTVQNHNQAVEGVGPAMRAALSLPDVPVAQRKGADGVSRGDVITRVELGSAHAIVDVSLQRSSRLPPKSPPLRHGARIRVHHGSGNIFARVYFLKTDELSPGASALAQLRFDQPVFMFAGDRFVVRDPSEQRTLAGGVLLDPGTCIDHFRTPAQQGFLHARAAAPEDVNVFIATQLARDHAIERDGVLRKSRFSEQQIEDGLRRLTSESRAMVRNGFVVDAAWWRQLTVRASALIDAAQRAHPNQLGYDLAALRSALKDDLPRSQIFEELLGDLCREDFRKTGDVIHRTNYRPTLPAQWQSSGARIRAALAVKPFDPPSQKELAPDALSQQALRFLRDTNEIVELNAEVVLLASSYAKMRDGVTAAVRKNGAATAGELRQVIGSSRRVMIPFLEQLDREGVTRRAGDRRTLAE